jgi:hypothetical protein
MSKENSSVISCGIGFPGLLFITFLVLKLTHVIDWSWWWITAPLWGDVLLGLLIIVVLCVFAVVAAIRKGIDR